jgi:hypothetical protein
MLWRGAARDPLFLHLVEIMPNKVGILHSRGPHRTEVVGPKGASPPATFRIAGSARSGRPRMDGQHPSYEVSEFDHVYAKKLLRGLDTDFSFI